MLLGEIVFGVLVWTISLVLFYRFVGMLYAPLDSGQSIIAMERPARQFCAGILIGPRVVAGAFLEGWLYLQYRIDAIRRASQQ
jgi:hypothetical protein